MRCIEFRDPKCVSQKGYRRSHAVEALAGGQRFAQCDLFDYVEKGAMIMGADGHDYQLRPNKTLLPTRWDLFDSHGKRLFSVELPTSLKQLLTPLGRELFQLEDHVNNRRYQLSALNQQKKDLILGPLSTGWHLVEEGVPVASVEKRKGGQPIQSRRGLLAALKSLMQNAEWILVDSGMKSTLPPIAFLVLIMLFDAHLARAQT
ncbi:hypothetical protein [Nitrincola sp. MINF-07-Sa-05]|uniref:hypothetical protein n=1 Tax=Nitrincola salilacus TaxID=3400273 RepID=UPI003918298C